MNPVTVNPGIRVQIMFLCSGLYESIAEGYSRPFMIIFIRILTNANFDEAERLVTDFFEKR